MESEATLQLFVKHGSKEHQVEASPSGAVQKLREQLEELTGVITRKQKLIFKGKVLDPGSSLQSYGLASGSKLMLLASEAVQTKGQQAASAAAQQRKELQKTATAATTQTLTAKFGPPAASRGTGTTPSGDLLERKAMWQKTGILGLRDAGISGALPPSLIEGLGGDSNSNSSSNGVRSADLSCNQLSSLPHVLGTLTGLTSLKLASNALVDAGMPWPQLCQLSALTLLTLDCNQLTCLPDEVRGFIKLQRLSVCDNQLSSIPPSLGVLTSLQELKVDNNRITSIPLELGGCCALLELSACNNLIKELPSQLNTCGLLATLRLDNNRISAIPTALLKGCSSLSLLSLGNNPVTAEQLRNTSGWDEFDIRRRARADKQLESRVMLGAGGGATFQEGADVEQWQRWGQNN